MFSSRAKWFMFGSTDSDANVVTQMVSAFNNTSLAHKHFPYLKIFAS